MIISGGKLIAIDRVRRDDSLSGDGVFKKLGIPTVSSVSALSSLSSENPNTYLNVGAVVDVVSALEDKIVEATPSLKNDIVVTNQVGMVFEGTTLSAGTLFEDIFSAAFTKYEEPSVSLALTPSTTSFSYDVSGTFEKEFTVTAKFVPGSLPITSFNFMGDNVEERIDTNKSYELIDSEDPIVIDGAGKTIISIEAKTERKICKDSKTIEVSKRYPIYYGTVLKSNYDDDKIDSDYIQANFKRENTQNINAGSTSLDITFENPNDDTIYMFLVISKKISWATQMPAEQSVTNVWKILKTVELYGKKYNVYKYDNHVTKETLMKFGLGG